MMAAWIDFPFADVIGKRFEGGDQRHRYGGTIVDVFARDSFVTFEHDAEGILEPKLFGCGADDDSWSFDSNGNVTISVPHVGVFTIYME